MRDQDSPRPAAAETPEFFRGLAELALDVVTVFDASGEIVYQSPSVTRMFGYDPAAMLGLSVLEFVHPDDRASTVAALTRVIDGDGEMEIHELRFRHRTDGWRSIEALARRWEVNGAPHVLVNTRDVTGRQETLEATVRASELFAKIFAVSSNILSITDPDSGKFIDVNAAWLAAAGLEYGEVIGRTASELGVWGAAVERDRIVAAIKAGNGRLRDYETTVHGRSGPRQMIFDVETLHVAGQPRLLMSGTDVTERRLTEEKLRQSQKMEVVGQLTGGVAHDFNNLLGIVLGNAEMLLEAIGDDPEREALVSAVIEAAERGATLTQQLLSFSRRQMLRPRSVRIDGRLNATLPLLRTTLNSNVVLSIEAPDDLWSCMVDPVQLENAVLNLVLNAHDALPSEGGTVRIVLDNHSIPSVEAAGSLGVAAGDYVRITVVDDGEGMLPDVLKKACEPFFTTKAVGRGTGLGLSMVFGFASQSGGQLAIESKVGSGTRVSLLLPRGGQVAPVDPPVATGKRVAGQEQGVTVLLLEDEPRLLDVIARQLHSLGYQVLTATGESDVERLLAEGATFDLLISDVILAGPRLGTEIALALQQERPGVPLMFISGYPADQLDIGAFANQSVPLLQKPFTTDELEHYVRTVLARAPFAATS